MKDNTIKVKRKYEKGFRPTGSATFYKKHKTSTPKEYTVNCAICRKSITVKTLSQVRLCDECKERKF